MKAAQCPQMQKHMMSLNANQLMSLNLMQKHNVTENECKGMSNNVQVTTTKDVNIQLPFNMSDEMKDNIDEIKSYFSFASNIPRDLVTV